MDKIEKATEEIANQRKLPEEIKARLNDYTFMNLVISIALMVYMMAINIIYLNEDIEFFSTSIKIFAIWLIIIDIIVFEIAYRKDNAKIWIHGFELLICSILVLSLQYIYLYADGFTKSMFMMLPVFYSIYYVFKVMIVHIIETNKYRNNLSDVKELIKDEEEGYLDDIKTDHLAEKELVEDVQNLENMKKQEQNLIKNAKKNKKGGKSK